MGAVNRPGRTLHATLCEIERGIFHATYIGCESASDTQALARYQVGTSAEDAKHRIERSAQAYGYDSVIWTQTTIAPLFASPGQAARHEPAPTSATRHGVASGRA
jgi:hypothetical protein